MEKLIKLKTPDGEVLGVQDVLAKSTAAITEVHAARGLLEEKAIQLRDHELMMSDGENLGHIKVGKGLINNDFTNATEVDEVPITERINNHNKDQESHDDVRKKLEEIPVLINAPTISGPSTVKHGVEYNFQIEATVNIPGIVVEKISVYLPNGSVISKSGDNVVGGYAVIPITMTTALEEEMQSIRVMAFDTNNSPSEASTMDIFVSNNDPPNLEAFTCTGLPAVMEPGTEVSVTLEGGVDSNGDPLTYTIELPSGSPLSVNKSSELIEGDSVIVSLSSSATRGRSLPITIRANDGKFMGESQKVINVAVNTLPVMTYATTTIPYYLNANSSVEAAVMGVTDDVDFTMSIACDSPLVSFSKSSVLHNNEVFIIDTSAELAPGTKVNFTITAIDIYGAQNIMTQECIVNTPPNIADMSAVYIATVAPEGEYTVRVSGATGGTAISYRLSTDCPYVTFTKNQGILEDESVSYQVSAGAAGVRGTLFNLNVSACDTRGGRSTAAYPFTINTLPNFAADVVLPKVVVPGVDTVVTLRGDAGDSGQAVSFDIECTSDQVTFSDTTAIVDGTELHIYPDADLVRGTTFVLTYKLSDGLESVDRPHTITVNRPPVVDAMTSTLPPMVNPGGSIPVSFTGATDPDSLTTEHLRYSVSSNNANVTFSKSSGILGGENITMSIAAGLARGVEVSVVVVVTDGNESTAKTFTTTVNALADVSRMEVDGLPSIIIPNGTYTLGIAGATDVNSGQELTYKVEASDAKIFFDKSNNLEENEPFVMSVGPGITRGTTIILTVSAYDGVEYVDKQFSLYVNTLPAVNAVVSTIPPVLRANHEYSNMSFAGLTDTSDSQSLFMSLVTASDIIFSKDTDLMNNEVFVMETGAVEAGSAVAITLTATDGLETNQVTLNRVMNIPPVIDNILNTGVPTDTVFGGTAINISFSGATEGTGIKKYHIHNNSPYLSFSSTADIAENAVVAMTPRRVAEITEVSFEVSATDSLDDPSLTRKMYTFEIHPLVKTTRPVVDYPSGGDVVPNDKDDPETFNISLSTYTTYIELDDDPNTDA